MKEFNARGTGKPAGANLAIAGKGPDAMPTSKDGNRPTPRHFFQPLPLAVWAVAGALAVAGLFSSNPVLTPCAVLMVPLLASLLWFPGEPPALLFACLMQWLQATIAIFYTSAHGVSLLSGFGTLQLYQATWLSMVAILVLALGMRLVLLRPRPETGAAAAREALSIRAGSLFAIYLVTYVVLYFVGRFAVGGLQQPLRALGSLRWVMVFLIAYTVLTQRRHYATLAMVVIIEMATGLLGYFAGFKSVFFVLLVALPAAGHFFRGWRLVQFMALSTVVLGLAMVWSAIKPEYREFLNQGSGQQEVLVSVPQRIEKLGELVGNLNRDSAAEAFDVLILRVSYVNYFALALGHVPNVIPHERGALWLGAVKHVLMPRLFFPNKPALDDSERTNYYCGVEVAGAEQGTSIGIGYPGESYIDFGAVGMFAPILLLGMFYGLIYRYFAYHSRIKLLGFAVAVAILIFGAYNIETSNTKLVGGNLMGVIVMGLFAKFGAPLLWTAISRQPVRVRVGGSRRKRRRKPIEPPGVTPNVSDHP